MSGEYGGCCITSYSNCFSLLLRLSRFLHNFNVVLLFLLCRVLEIITVFPSFYFFSRHTIFCAISLCIFFSNFLFLCLHFVFLINLYFLRLICSYLSKFHCPMSFLPQFQYFNFTSYLLTNFLDFCSLCTFSSCMCLCCYFIICYSFSNIYIHFVIMDFFLFFCVHFYWFCFQFTIFCTISVFLCCFFIIFFVSSSSNS